MKHVATLFFITAIAMNITAMEIQEMIIRPAEMKDLNAVNDLCDRTHYSDGFKKGFGASLSSWMMLGCVTDEWVNKQVHIYTQLQVNKNIQCISEQQKNPSDNRLLVAYLQKAGNEKQLAGYCLFNKKNAKQIFMSYFAVTPELRNKGVGKLLAYEAFKTFDGITSCRFRWLANDKTMNNFFEKHCIEEGNVHLDWCSGRIIEEVPEKELKDKIFLPIAFREFVFARKSLQ